MVTEEEIREVILLNKNLSLTQIRFLIKNPSIAKSVNLKAKHKTQLRVFRRDNVPSSSVRGGTKTAPSMTREITPTYVKKAKRVYKKKPVVTKKVVKAPVKVVVPIKKPVIPIKVPVIPIKKPVIKLPIKKPVIKLPIKKPVIKLPIKKK